MSDLRIGLTQHDPSDVLTRLLGGHNPFVLIEVSVEDEVATYDMTTGGGVPEGDLSSVANVLEVLTAALRENDPNGENQ